MRFLDLPARLGGHLRQAPADPAAPVRHLLLDSRRVSGPGGTLFFALRGPRHDGHRYLPALYAQGIRLFVVEAGQPLPGGLGAYPQAGIIAVASPLAGLQALAAARRATFGGPVLAVTGSNGKTIIKEWLAQLLAPDEAVCRSPRSYNSQVGVPLSVWELSSARHTLGIFEAGISEVGEMARLAAVIRPTEGLFTTLGTAHDAGFASSDQKLREKLKLFEGPQFQRLYYCADQPAVAAAVAALGLPGFGWSAEGNAAAAVRFVLRDPGAAGAATAVLAHYPAGPEPGAAEATASFGLHLPDAPTRQNVLHCLAVLLARGVAPAEIQRRLDRLHPVAMRLEMKQGRHGSYLLDDAYNNDLAGLALALDALARQARPGRRTVILSDVLESGLPPAALYGQVAALLARHGVARLVAIGPELNELKIKNDELKIGDADAVKKAIAKGDSAGEPEPFVKKAIAREDSAGEPELFVKKAIAKEDSAGEPEQFLIFNSEFLIQAYPTTDAFLAALDPADFARETILIKGARQFGFERVVAALQAQQHGTVLEVNLDALTHNLNHFRQRLAAGTRVMVMVKAFAYGAGSYEVASLLEFQRADYLAVAYPDEGVALREAGISLPIMVMNPAPDSFGLLRRYRLEPEIYSFEMLDEYLAAFENGEGRDKEVNAPTPNPQPPTPTTHHLPPTTQHPPTTTHHPTPPRFLAALGMTVPPIHLKLDTGMHRLGFDEKRPAGAGGPAAGPRRGPARSQPDDPPGRRRSPQARRLHPRAASHLSAHERRPGGRPGPCRAQARPQFGWHRALPGGAFRHGASRHRPLRRGRHRHRGRRRALARECAAHHRVAGENAARRAHRGLRPARGRHRSAAPHCHAGHRLRRRLRPPLRPRRGHGAHSGAGRAGSGQRVHGYVHGGRDPHCRRTGRRRGRGVRAGAAAARPGRPHRHHRLRAAHQRERAREAGVHHGVSPWPPAPGRAARGPPAGPLGRVSGPLLFGSGRTLLFLHIFAEISRRQGLVAGRFCIIYF